MKITDCHIHIQPVEMFKAGPLEVMKKARGHYADILEYCRSPKALGGGPPIGGPRKYAGKKPLQGRHRPRTIALMEQWGGLVILVVALLALAVAVIDILCSGMRKRKADRD